MPTVRDWESLEAKRRKLRNEEENAIMASQEAMAKILRLRKQQRLLDEREQKMIAAGLNSLDELDALEKLEKDEQEARKKAASEAAAQPELAATEDGPSDWLGGELSELDPALATMSGEEWDAYLSGIGVGIPQASQGG